MRRAVIDIGTNSVKLLVADVHGDSVRPLWEKSEQTRLGEGLSQNRQLDPAAIQRTAQAVARFAAVAKEWDPVTVRAIATNAAREAINQKDLAHAVFIAAGLEVEVISWQQEAEWAYAGVRTNPELANNTLLILDVGGGSTEFILGRGPRQIWQQSVPIGTVRLLEEIQPSDPPSASDWARCSHRILSVLQSEVQPVLGKHLDGLHAENEEVSLVGTGGTTTILAAMEQRLTSFDRDRIEQTRLSRDRIWEFKELLWSLPLRARQELPGLPPNRADVVLFGVAAWAFVMEICGFTQLRVSTRGLRFAAATMPHPGCAPS